MKPMQVIDTEDLLKEAKRSNLKLRIVEDNMDSISVDGNEVNPYWQEAWATVSNFIHPTSVLVALCNRLEEQFGAENQILIRRIKSTDLYQGTETRITFEAATIN